MPRIWVCAAPDTPTAQRSLFIELIDGAMADGGGDFTVVSDSLNDLELEVDVDVLVLFEVEFEVLSVTMVCAMATLVPNTTAIAARVLFIVFIIRPAPVGHII